jgi:lysosomal alpha-mannosidase
VSYRFYKSNELDEQKSGAYIFRTSDGDEWSENWREYIDIK